jgi:fatty-acyl-CoA synthase
LTHGNILWNAMGTAASWALHARSRALLNAPLFHTGGMNVLTAPLVWVGGCSYVASGFDAGQALELIDAGKITCFFGVPTMFDALARHPRFDAADFGEVELVISGGAPCPAPLFDALWAKGVPFKTGYGLTEAGPNNFWLPDPLVREKPGCVGYPLLHVDARIVDEAGEDAPAATPGELLLRGPHVTPGYWGDEAATRAALDAAGWLHTGDLALRDDDGVFRIVGRKKDMYISGGENVYPAEVESVLRSHPAVVEAAVIGEPHEKWGEVGHAHVVSSDPTLDAAALDAFLASRLAKYQRPARVSFHRALPQTGAGKVDRRALQRAADSDP